MKSTVAAAVLVLSPAVHGQTDDTTRVYPAEPVVISASRFPQRLGDVGRFVSFVNKASMEEPGSATLGDVLSRVAGAYLPGTAQTPGMIQSLFLRGTNSNQTAVYVDDVPLTDPSAVNNALDVSELSLIGLDRIEVVRGSHSTLFGSSAVGGVVHLISETHRTPGWHLQTAVGGGWINPGTWLRDESLRLNYSDPGGWYVAASGGDRWTNGIDATVDSTRNGEPGRDRDGFRKQSARMNAGYRDDRLEVSAGGWWTGQRARIDKRAFVDDGNYVIDFTRIMTSLSVLYRIDQDLRIRLTGGYSAMDRDAEDDSSVVRGVSDRTYVTSENAGASSSAELHLLYSAPAVEAVAGGGYRRETMNVRNYLYSAQFGFPYESRVDLDSLDLASTSKFLFVFGTMRPGVWLPALSAATISAGLRWTDNDRFGVNWVWELSPVVHLTEVWQLYGSVATGYNAPSLYQMYNPVVFSPLSVAPGNDRLKPERSLSAEIGLRIDTHEGTQVSVSLSRTRVDDVITYVYLWDKTVGIDTLGNDWLRNDFRGDTYLNVGSQTVTVLEAAWSQRLSADLVLSANVALLQGNMEYRPGAVDAGKTLGNHVQLFDNGRFLTSGLQNSGLPRRPSVVNLSLQYDPSEAWGVRVDVRHVGKRNDVEFDAQIDPYGALVQSGVAAYTVVDAGGSLKWTDRWTVRLRAENLLDAQYAEIKGFATRGRSMYASVSYGF